jgi:hypothetical protein
MLKAPLCVASPSRLRLLEWGEDELLFRDLDSDRVFGVREGAIVPHPPLPCVDPRAEVYVERAGGRRRRVIARPMGQSYRLEVWSQLHERERDHVETTWHADGLLRVIGPLANAQPWLALATDGALLRVADGAPTLVQADVEEIQSKSLGVVANGLLAFNRHDPLTVYPLDGSAPRKWRAPKLDVGDGCVRVRGEALVVANSHSGKTTLLELAAATLEERASCPIAAETQDIVLVGGDSVLARTDGGLLMIQQPFGAAPKIERIVREMEYSEIAGCGDRFIARELDAIYVGRLGVPSPTFVRMKAALTIGESWHVGERGVVFQREHTTTFIPWSAFEKEGELVADRLEIALASRGHRAKVLIAGTTILRIEILEPSPTWSRTTMTVPSQGNPLGLRVGEEVIAEGPEVAGELTVTAVRRADEAGTSGDRVVRGEVESFGRVGAVALPAWVSELVALGLIDTPDVLPAHAWESTPVNALAAIYEPRAAMHRGFLRYDWKFWRDTEDPAADLVALSRASEVEARCIDPDPEEEEVRVESRVGRGRRRVTTVPLGGGSFSELVAHINDLLARAGASRRIYEWETGGDSFAFLSVTPDEWKRLVTKGIAG